MNKNKRILFVSPGCPYPLIDGGAIRIYQDLMFLKRMGFAIDLIYVSHYDDDKIVKEGLKSVCDNVYRYHISKIHSYWNVLKGLILNNRKPMQVNYFYLPKVKKFIEDHHSQYDMLFAVTVRAAEYIRKCNNTKVIDYIDSIALGYEKGRHYKKDIWRFLYDIDYRLLSKYEKNIFDDFNIRFIISDVDRKNIIGASSKKMGIVRNFYTIKPGRTVPQREGNHNIVFVGSMFYDPNVVAAVYFVKEVLPSIVAKYPDTKFYIVGNRPTREVQNLASDHVVVTGYVDDVWPYLQKAGVIVVPMMSGAGLQNKILEALSIRACIVTTITGAGGLVRDEGAPLIANNTDEMISKICDVFEMSIEHRKEMVDKGFNYLLKYYTEDVVFESFRQQFHDLK